MKYLVLLQSLSPFFFGSETTFGKLKEQNYFVRSNRFPQQTSIVGMLRYEILVQSGLLKDRQIDNFEKAKKLIGEKSFDIENENDFGIIKSISPLILFKKKDNEPFSIKDNNPEYFIKTPLDFGMAFKEKKGIMKISTGSKDSLFIYAKKFIPELTGYKAKNGLSDSFTNLDTGDRVESSDIFKEHEQVGTRKPGNTNDESQEYTETENPGSKKNENAFYKQVFYRFTSGYGFAFFLDIDENEDFKLSDSTVFLGGERSAFKMTLLEAKDISFDALIKGVPLYCNYIEETGFNKIIALSDCYIDENSNIFDECDFIINRTVNFRNITTYLSKNYHFKKNNFKYTFMSRGSVFFFSDREKSGNIEGILNNKKMQKIGYNKYKIFHIGVKNV